MNISLTIYIWGLLDTLKQGLNALALFYVFSLIVAAILGDELINEISGKLNIIVSRWLKYGAWLAVPAALISLFLPSSKTYAAMVIVPAIAQSDAIQKDLPEVYKAAVEKLKESLKVEAEKP